MTVDDTPDYVALPGGTGYGPLYVSAAFLERRTAAFVDGFEALARAFAEGRAS